MLGGLPLPIVSPSLDGIWQEAAKAFQDAAIAPCDRKLRSIRPPSMRGVNLKREALGA